MAKKSFFLFIAGGLLFGILPLKTAQTQTLSGKVYEGITGTEPPTAKAIPNVTVILYGTNTDNEDPTKTGSIIQQTTTDPQGWFSLQVRGAYDYYNIVEVNPSGYSSDGATTVGGTVKTSDWIQYMSDDLSGTTTGNKFWDQPPAPPNKPPIADAGGYYNGTVNHAVQFDGSGSYDPDTGDSIAKYEWDMDNDGQYDDATGVNPVWTWHSSTLALIYLKVTDTHGAADTDSSFVDIKPEQSPCEAAFDADPREGCAPLTVNFTDISSNAQSWLWTFPGGNPSSSTQQNPTVTYQNPGLYAVKLKITCANGIVDSVSAGDYILVQDCSNDMDFGDAPDPIYPTLLASNGARHDIDPDVYLGSSVDADPNGQQSSDASGDDSDGNDDDDGVVFKNPFVPGSEARFDIMASQKGNIGIWVDFNGDGDWADPGECAFNTDTTVSAGVNSYWGIQVPSNAKLGKTFARFRYSTKPGQTYNGSWPDGEVEDYEVEIVEVGAGGYIGDHVWNDLNHNGLQDAGETGIANVTVTLYDANGSSITSTMTNSNGNYEFSGLFNGIYKLGFTLLTGYIFSPVDQGTDDAIDSDANPSTGETALFTLLAGDSNNSLDAGMYQSEGPDQMDFGDAPDPTYPTLMASNGARHVVQQGFFLGSVIDAEPNGQPTTLADGDNIAGANDEDGVQIPPIITPGSAVSVKVIATALGTLNAWLDFNINGSWADAGEQIISAQPVVAGVNSFTINVPAGAVIGQSYARFRLSSVPNISYNGLAPDGEVEDYAIAIQKGGGGNLTIIKDATPKDDTPFWITVVYGAFGGAAPYRDPSSNSSSVVNGPTGIYQIGESVPAGWTLTDIVVTGDADNGSTIDVPNSHVDIDLDPGENITVVFKNIKIGWEEFDFGDAPAPYPSASHLLGGPWEGNWGSKPDAEPGMQPDPYALGDDNNGIDDESDLFVQNGYLAKGSVWNMVQQNIYLDASGNAKWSLWIDFNGDGDWNDSGENLSGFSLIGFTPYSTVGYGWIFQTPSNAKIGKTMARFRIWSDNNEAESPSGPGGAGEVADYEIEIKADGPGFPSGGIIFGRKWHDLNGDGIWNAAELPLAGWNIWLDINKNGIHDGGEPTTLTDAMGNFIFTGIAAGTYDVYEDLLPNWTQTFPGSPNYHTLAINPNQPTLGISFGNKNNGDTGELDFGDAPLPYPQFMSASVNPNFKLGQEIDSESAAQADPHALGDDQSGIDDEDGVTFMTPLQPGQTASVQVDLTGISPNFTPRLWAWLDFNGDGDWTDAGEKVIDQLVSGGSVQSFYFTVPATATIGTSFARFFLIDGGPLPPNGYPFGEIEDYEIEIGQGQGTPLKWSQPPLFDTMSNDTTSFWGWNEGAIYTRTTLADDWFCHDPRPVTVVRWWGSYQEWDSLITPPQAPHAFQIGVWTDIADDPAVGFSHPGEMIHEWIVNRNQVHETLEKSHYYPELMQKPLTCFRYTFNIPHELWFYQQGDSTVYWLSITALYDEMPDKHFWGWLTREHYFNDDAVRVEQPVEPHPGEVYENGVIIADFRDFAFELGTDEYESIYDFGDAPDLGYGTTYKWNGPHHLFDPDVRLGETIDSEPDGQPRADARGDDEDGGADEDGVLFLNDLIPGEMAGIQVTTSTHGFLNAWVDFYGDTHWNWPFDFVITDYELSAGAHLLEFPVDEKAQIGKTLARFRFSTRPKVYFRGYAVDGEVEDYQVIIRTTDAVRQLEKVPNEYMLYQNYPNPFNPSTQISFALPKKSRVELAIYNVRGSKIRTLVSGIEEPGIHVAIWDGADKDGSHVASGFYFCRIEAAEYQNTIKMLILK